MPRIHQLTLVSRYMEEILVKRNAERDVEDEATKVCEDEIDVDTLIPFPPPPDVWSEPPRITSTFLITAPKYREPRYYFPPLPLHRRSLTNKHPPDIRAPKPIPPKPNISIRSPTFQQSHHSPGIRPCRKHPPHSLIPRHYRNVVCRISNKGRLRLS